MTEAGQLESARTRWYSRWFGEAYLQLYPHRDREEAERAVALVLEHAPVPEGARVLDIACGAGRHLSALRDRGVRPVGLDLSETLLRVGRRDHPDIPVVRGDMRRLPFDSGAFDLVTSFFTSFGYFPEMAEDRQVLGEARRVLTPGGRFAFDFLNARRVRALLQPRDERVLEGRRVVQTRRLVEDDQVVEKRIEIHAGGGSPDVFYERVRLYAPEELEVMLERGGFIPLERFGDYDGTPLEDDSPRVILLGRAR